MKHWNVKMGKSFYKIQTNGLKHKKTKKVKYNAEIIKMLALERDK